jgi:N-terminal domain of toast_rack, DUF2154
MRDMLRLSWVPVAILLAGCSIEAPGETRSGQQAVDVEESAKSTRIRLEMSAGELMVASGASKLMEGEFTYNVDRFKPIIERNPGELRIFQDDDTSFEIGAEARWDLRLNSGVPLDVIARLGAGEAELDLGELNLQSLEVGIGAGEVNVDLRGTPKQSYKVRIEGGVGETVVYLPRSVGISATAAGGLSSISVNGLEKRGDRWVNAGHENDMVQISVDVKGGIGEIRLTAE